MESVVNLGWIEKFVVERTIGAVMGGTHRRPGYRDNKVLNLLNGWWLL